MKIITSLLILLSLVAIIIGLPQFTPKKTIQNDELPNDFSNTVTNDAATSNAENSKKFNYASVQSQIVATSLLKDNMDIDGNHIYSPLGISSILAVLAEGSRGDTYKEFITALGYPENKTELRDSFKRIFENFHEKPLDFTDNTSPTFKTWLYIYRNNTARQEFKDILTHCYSVEVKDINRTEFDWNLPDTATRSVANNNETSNGNTGLVSVNSKDVLPVNTEPVNSKDVLNFEDLKKSETFDNEENNNAVPEKESEIDDLTPQVVYPTDLIKEASKFDSNVEDKQYVEVPFIKAENAKLEQEKQKLEQQRSEESRKDDDMILIEEMIKLKDKSTIENFEKEKTNKDEKLIIKNINDENIEPKLTNDENDEFNVEDNETIKDDEKLEELRKHVDGKNEILIEYVKESSNEPEKIIIPIEKLDDDEIMEAAESRNFRQRVTGSRTLLRKDDIASALSANSITGKESPIKTKMLLFNGLYYRGNWAYPFQELRKAHVKEPFYVSSHKSMPVEMMRTHGRFQIGNLDSLDSQAIVLPYENKRYSFVLIVPNDKEGLRKLIETIQPVDLQLLSTRLIDMDTSVCLPKFEVEETSRSETTLKKLGLKKIFSKYTADLGDIAEDSSLHVEEIVQHVNLRVDEGAASKNSLTGSNPSIDNKQIQRSDIIKDDDKSIVINRPFLYFVMDQLNDFVIIAGKITAPEFIEEFGLADDV